MYNITYTEIIKELRAAPEIDKLFGTLLDSPWYTAMRSKFFLDLGVTWSDEMLSELRRRNEEERDLLRYVWKRVLCV